MKCDCHITTRLTLVLALAGCALWQPYDPESGDRPGSFKYLIELKQKGREREFYERVRELRRHAEWLRENGHAGRAAALEARLREILDN
jgi:hypothetical protein